MSSNKKAATKTRSTHTKVRTGCITCKTRRVKCDEARPICARCIKFGVVCDGYSQTALQRHFKPRALRPFIVTPKSRPQEYAEGREITSLPLSDPFVPVYRQPASLQFRSPDEFRYFKLYCEKTARHLGGYYDPILWSRIVLQASELESSIRHAVIAIGALEMTTSKMRESRKASLEKSVESSSNMFKNSVDLAETHHTFALQQYSEAIKDMREELRSGMQDMRTTLVASLLIICFETYHGNIESASRQVYTSVKLLKDWMDKKLGKTPHPLRVLSPAPDAIEDDLVNAFVRLDVQTSGSNVNQYSVEEHFRLKDAGVSVIDNMPECFANVSEARDYFNAIIRRASHFGILVAYLGKPNLYRFKDGTTWMRGDMLAASVKYVAELEKWVAAFTPVFNRARASSATDFHATSHLRLHYLAISVRLRHLLDEDEMGWDNSIDSYREMVNLTKALLEGDDSVFAFNLQNIWPLEVVGLNCRDPRIRRDAIYLLVSKPRRELVWDSVVTGRICTWVMSTEEHGMVDGIIPEVSRLRSVRVKFDLENRKANVLFKQPVKSGAPGELRSGQTVITW